MSPEDAMSTGDLDRRLREAGQAHAPEPRPAFAEALEHQLRAGVTLAPAPVAVLRPARRAGSQWALAAAAVVLVALAVASRPDPVEQLKVASANDAVVVFPGGVEEPAVPGLVVPDGSVIRTGEGGRVVAGKVEIGPNREAVVAKGAVRTQPRPARPAVTPPPEPPVASPPEEEPPSAPPAKDPVAAPTTSTTSTTRPKPIEQVGELKLEVWYRGTTVQLAWSPYEGPRFAGYVVLRSDAPYDPGYPPDKNTKVLGRVMLTRFTDTPVEDPGGRRYRVVAVDENGQVLAKSRAVAPQPSATATQ
jgi:hypothetical protein